MKIPEPPANGPTTVSYAIGESPVISQEAAYEALGALKLVLRLLDMHAPHLLGTLDGYVRSAMLKADREASKR